MVLDKEGQDLRATFQAYAESKELKLNPNEKVVEGIIAGLLRNKKFKGDIY